MRRILGLHFVVVLVAGLAPALMATETVDEAQRRSQEQLDASLAELASLREQIAERSCRCRRLEGWKAPRPAAQTERPDDPRDRPQRFRCKPRAVKLREDGLPTCNLLDECVRGFETKLGVGQRYRRWSRRRKSLRAGR
jgi:hypothetical protein